MTELDSQTHQIGVSMENGQIIAPTAEQRRALARVVLLQGRQYGLLCFGLADTHLHLEVHCARAAVGRFLQRSKVSLRRRLGLVGAFARPWIERIRTGRHRFNTFRYGLTQNGHHGLEWDPYHEASNLPDLLGLRVHGADTADNVRCLLPRVTRKDLLSWIGLERLDPADGPVAKIPQAALQAAGLNSLRGSSRVAIAARRAVVDVIGRRLPQREIAALLGVGRRTVHWLHQRTADSRLVRAIRLQLGLMAVRGDAPAHEQPYVEALRDTPPGSARRAT